MSKTHQCLSGRVIPFKKKLLVYSRVKTTRQLAKHCTLFSNCTEHLHFLITWQFTQNGIICIINCKSNPLNCIIKEGSQIFTHNETGVLPVVLWWHSDSRSGAGVCLEHIERHAATYQNRWCHLHHRSASYQTQHSLPDELSPEHAA